VDHKSECICNRTDSSLMSPRSQNRYGKFEDSRPSDLRHIGLQILQKDFNKAREMGLKKPYIPLYKGSGINPMGSLPSIHVESSETMATILGEVFEDITKEVLQIIPNKEEH
jgi:hypothetical protein